jgi:predicted MFS family arabinose efflux permease
VILVYGAVGYLTAAAQSGLIRDLVDDDSLASANGVLTTIDQGFRLISPLIGTALYVVAGPGAVVVLTASCFAITAVLIARVRVVESEPEVRTGTSRYWHEVGAGFAHLARTPLLNRVTLALTIAFGAVGLVNVAIFPALEQGLKVDTAVLGILVPVQGVGALVGGILSARIVTALGEARAVGLGLALVALGCVPAVFTSLAGVVAGMAVLGFGIPVIVVGFATLRQRRTPATLQGRTAAAGNVAINVPQTLASVFGVALISVVDYRVLVLSTVVTVLAAAVIAAAGRRAIVDIEAPAGS